MSRVGKVPITIPSGVKFQMTGRNIRVEGPKGKLTHELPEGVLVKQEGDQLQVSIENPSLKEHRSLFGVTRTHLANMVKGVHTGFQKDLDIVGVGFRAAVKGQVLSLTIGYSHPVDFKLPQGVEAKVDKNTHLVLTGADKVILGLTAAKIRAYREPEPYQGKGIKYTDEHIVRKQGKAAGAGAK